MNMPVYKANVGQYNVPSLNSQAEQQNANIVYKGLASFSDSVNKTAMNMYQMQKAEEAQIEGAKAAEEGIDLNNMPEAKTRGQQIFNQAAIDNYAVSFNVDATRKINELRYENRDNAAKFLTESDSYLRGVSQGIPAHLKGKILYPIQIQAEAAYNKLLNSQLAKQEKASEQMTMFNLNVLGDEVSNSDFNSSDPKEVEASNIKQAQYTSVLRSAISSGKITADFAQKKLNDINKGIAFNYVSRVTKDSGMTAKEMIDFQNSILAGKTKSVHLNSLSPMERAELLSTSLATVKSLEQESERRTQINDKNQFDLIKDGMFEYDKFVVENPEASAEELAEVEGKVRALATKDEHIQYINNIVSRDPVTTGFATKQSLDMMVAKGTLTYGALSQIREQGIPISRDDYNKYLKVVISPLETNKKTDAWENIKELMDVEYPVTETMFGRKIGDNRARAYVEVGMKNFMSKALRTDEEFQAEYERLSKQAKSIDGQFNPMPKPLSEIVGANTTLSLRDIEQAGQDIQVSKGGLFKKGDRTQFFNIGKAASAIVNDLMNNNQDMDYQTAVDKANIAIGKLKQEYNLGESNVNK